MSTFTDPIGFSSKLLYFTKEISIGTAMPMTKTEELMIKDFLLRPASQILSV